MSRMPTYSITRRFGESLFVDLQIKVAKIAGGGTDASNIAGRVTYLAGIVGLAPDDD